MRFSSRERSWWFALLLLSLIARLAGLGYRALSHDESLHAQYSFYWSNGLNYKHDPMMHGPLLFHLNGLINLVFPINDFTSRLVPALFGVGCVALLWLYRRWMGKTAAFTAAVLVSIDPAHLYYSRYLRNDIYISFFTLLMVWAILRYREEQKPRHLLWLSFGLALSFTCKEICFIHGTVLGAACLFFAGIDSIRTRQNPLFHPLTVCGSLLLFLALPFASPLLQPDLPWTTLAQESTDIYKRILAVALIVFGCSTGIGILYFNRVKRLEAFSYALLIFWGVIILLYTTFFTNILHGLASGVGGSLGYWLAQHEVERGNASPLFYLSLLLLYAPVLLSGLIFGCCKLKHHFIAFLVFWTLGNAVIYSWAGERMPWLLTHITLPLCLLTGLVAARLYASTSLRKLPLQLLIGLGFFQLAANSFRAAGPHAEGATEPLMYAHSGPHIKTALNIIDYQLSLYPGSNAVAHEKFAWPMVWYFRDKPIVLGKPDPDTVASNTVALMVPPWDKEKWVDAGWMPRLTVDMTTWPRPQYHELSRKNFKNVIQLPAVRKKMIRYYLFRDQPEWKPGEWPGPDQFLLVTRDLPSS